MKPATLKQIAEILGISIGTVSKSLKDYPDISEPMKLKVQKLAKELNYTPNSFAVNLKTKQSKTIGVIIPDTVHHFFSTVIKGILKEAKKNGYLVILMQSEEVYEQEIKLVDLLISKGVDGILISLSNETKEFKHLDKIKKYDIPLVLFDKISKRTKCSKVKIDDKAAAYDAVTYLISKGHKRIAHFRGSLYPQNSIDRFSGYKKALKDNDIKFDPSLVYMCDNDDDFDDGYDAAEALIKDHGNDIDAIFTITDLVAIGALKYFNDHNIKVPNEIALFGFSNWFISSVVSPSISTVDQPGYEMGKTATNILLREINNMHNKIPIKHETVTLKTDLVIRKSS